VPGETPMNKKRGFTILELIIVIAVIAILAAVMIPTFNSIANKTKQSSDIQMVRSLNAALQADSKKHGTMYDALICVEKSGFTLASITNNELPDHVIAWESAKDRFVLINTKTDKCVFPKSEYKGEGSDVITNKYKYFVVYDEVPSIEEQSYSIYLSDTARIRDVEVVVGFDAGTNRYVKYLIYDRSGADSAQNVIIRTNDNGTTCEFNGYVNPSNSSKGDTIHHYGNSGNQVISIADDSYHEHGAALAVEVKKGHYAQEKGSIVSVLNASASEGDVRVELKNGSIQGTVKNTNDQNAVTIVSASNVVTVNIEVKTDGGELKVSLLSQPYYANILDCEEENANSKKVSVKGIGIETFGKNNRTAPGSESVCGDGHDFITIAGSSVKICTRCSAYEYTLAETIDAAESDFSDIEEKTYTCIWNEDGTTEVIKSHDHSFGDPEWLWNGYESASAKFVCTDEDCNRIETVIVPDTSSYISSEVTTEPTCTESGERTYTANLTHHGVEFASKSPSEEVLEAIGHNYEESVTEPTCTEQGYTTHTCSRCNHSYDDTYTEVVAHNYLEAVTLPTCVDEGYTTYTCSWCGKRYVSDPVPATGHSGNLCSVCGAQSISVVFPNTDKYLYRVGNQNVVSISNLFEGYNNDTSFSIEKIHGDADGLIINGSVSFTGTGVVKVTADNSVDLLLEVVDAYNAISAMNASDKNVCLLNNIAGGFNVSNGYCLFGNGFTVDISSDVYKSDLASGFIALENGHIDNVVINCPVLSEGILYTSQRTILGYTSPNNVKYYYNTSSGIACNGCCEISNSFISGGRAAIHVVSGNTVITNTTVSGGSLANILISSAVTKVVLDNTTTIQVPTQATVNNTSKTVVGLGVLALVDDTGSAASIEILGDLNQYNWIDSSFTSYAPSGASFVLSQALSQADYKHSINGKVSINSGIAYINSEGNAVGNQSTKITDNRPEFVKSNRPYSAITKSNTTVYSYNNSKGTDDSLVSYTGYTASKQCDTMPMLSFSYSNANVSFEKEFNKTTGKWEYVLTANDIFTLNFGNLHISKYDEVAENIIIRNANNNSTITNYEVELIDISTKTYSISFGCKARYDRNGFLEDNSENYEYVFSVISKVEKINPPVLVTQNYEAGLCVASSYGGTWSGAAPALEGIVIRYYSSSQKKYVDLSLSTLTPSTKGKQNGTNKTWTYSCDDYLLTLTGGQVHSSNKVDAMPVVCNSKLYFVASGTSGLVNSGNSARSVPVSYSFTANGETLTFSHTWSVAEDKNNEYKYNDFINGTLTKLSKSSSSSSCLTPDTLILMADGTEKQVQYVVSGDELLVFNHETGEVETSFVLFNDVEEEQQCEVINLDFSNGKRVKVISEHGFFDLNLNKYVYIDAENYADFVGHRFYGIEGEYTLEGAFLTYETMAVYSPVTYSTLNYFTEGMLSMPGGITGLFNIFDYDDDLKYNQASKSEDIATYGLFTAEEMEPIGVTEIMFNAYNGQYLKVALGKGILTEDYLAYLIERYGGFTE